MSDTQKPIQFTESELDALVEKKGYKIANEIEDETLDELNEEINIIDELESVYKSKLFLLKSLEKQIKLRFSNKYEAFVKNMTGVKTGASFQYRRIYDKLNEVNTKNAFTQEEIEKFLDMKNYEVVTEIDKKAYEKAISNKTSRKIFLIKDIKDNIAGVKTAYSFAPKNIQKHSECFNFNVEKRIFNNYTILVRYSKRIRQLLKHDYRNIPYHKPFNKRRFNNLKEKSKTYYCKRCNDILTIENFCYKCESEDLDNSESIHTNSPKSDNEGSNYITDDGFVIKDDINTSYIQHEYYSFLNSFTKAKNYGISIDLDKATNQIESALDVNTNLLIQHKKIMDEIESTRKEFSLCILVNPAPNNTIWLNRRNNPEKHYYNLYQLVGGLVEPNETFELCAFREVHEEAGINIKELNYICQYKGFCVFSGNTEESLYKTLVYFSILEPNQLPIQTEPTKSDEWIQYTLTEFEKSQYMLTPTLEVKKKKIVETIKTKLTQHNRKRKRVNKEEKEEKEEVNGVNWELNGVNLEVKDIEKSILLSMIKNFEATMNNFKGSLGILVYNSKTMKTGNFLTKQAKLWLENTSQQIIVCNEEEVINEIKNFFKNDEEPTELLLTDFKAESFTLIGIKPKIIVFTETIGTRKTTCAKMFQMYLESKGFSVIHRIEASLEIPEELTLFYQIKNTLFIQKEIFNLYKKRKNSLLLRVDFLIEDRTVRNIKIFNINIENKLEKKYIDNLIDEEIFKDKVKFDKVVYIKPSFLTTINHKKKRARPDETCKNDYLKNIYMEYESRVDEIYLDHIVFDNIISLCENCQRLQS
ncbi:21552_t:CDS:2, partial [Racocetra persica]